MKFLKHIIAVPLILGALCGLWSCNDDDGSKLSEAVLASASALNFEGTGAAEKLITIYADANWISEAPEWITITPASGTGVTDVTVKVTDNLRGGTLDNPRKATVIFKGRTLASEAKVLVNQVGDKYRDVQDYAVDKIAALADETVVSVSEVIVMALTTSGFIVSDANNSANVYVLSESTVNVGDKVSIMGEKSSDTNSLAVVEADNVTVVTTGGTVTYPIAEDITNNVDGYGSDSRAYIVVSGILNGSNIVVDGAAYSVSITDAPASMGVAALNGHKVTVSGYFAGVAAPVVRIMASEIVDEGVFKVVYFSDDLEWMDPWSVASTAGNTIENNGDQNARNVYTYAALTATPSFVGALEDRGYKLVCAPSSTTSTYLQKNYLKFGRTDVQAGIVLPAMDNIPAGTNVTISFDWAPMMGGTGNFDPVEMLVIVNNEGNEVEFGPFGHNLVNTVDKMAWLHAEALITGVTITSSTKITIRSKVWEATAASTGSSVYQRWFIDNIEVTKTE